MANVLLESYLCDSNKLDGENYANWKFKLQNLMEGYNIWMIVSRAEVKLVPPQAKMLQFKTGNNEKTNRRCFCEFSLRTTLFHT